MSPLPRTRGRLLGDELDDRVVVGDSNLSTRSIGVGSGKNRTDAGKLNAQYVDVDLTNVPDLNNVNVSHRLGAKPTFIELVEVRNTGLSAAPTASVMPVSKHLWTGTNGRVAVTVSQQAGTVLKFRVGGS